MRVRSGLALAALASVLAAEPALAHTGVGATHGFVAGLTHPLFGLDHVCAMVAVGLWAALAGGRAVWAWPLAFVGVMVAGALLGLAGLSLPGVEVMIAGSVFAFGIAVALRAPLPVLVGAVICGLFALFHGHAHGTELPAEASAALYVAGFALATALLHAVGLSLGLLLARLDRVWTPRLVGSAVAATGMVLLVG
ncbi:MAG TPA: HupE/UreJ family protein [Beijerinckiaceae bacterium]|jgi:urease accessory protein